MDNFEIMDIPEDLDILINTAYYSNDYKSVVCELKSDKVLDKDETTRFIKNVECRILLYIYESMGNINVRCIVPEEGTTIRAMEFMDYLFEEYGLVEGNVCNAEGKISNVLLKVYMSEMNTQSYIEYFVEMTAGYFENTDIVNTESDNYDISSMSRFVKKAIPWAYVKTTDIAPEGTEIILKSLENTTGMTITVSENTFVMIGNCGEVYDIDKTKFDASYNSTNETLDVFESMLDFMPTVEKLPENVCVPIDEMAHLCYPDSSHGIYAKQLKKRTKVFASKKPKDYFIGKKGDYLAVRWDDLKDIYIIKKDIFKNTYEPC